MLGSIGLVDIKPTYAYNATGPTTPDPFDDTRLTYTITLADVFTPDAVDFDFGLDFRPWRTLASSDRWGFKPTWI